MTRDNFTKVLGLISFHPVFFSTGVRQQRPVYEQLAVFLMRCSGKMALHTSTDAAIAEGTIYLYCKRVCTALLDLRNDKLSWPNQQQREVLKAEMEQYGFPGCIGILDATLIPLMDKPKNHGWSYFCRKKFYAVRCHSLWSRALTNIYLSL